MSSQVLAGGGQIRPGMTVIRTPIQQTGPMGKTILRTPLVVQQGSVFFVREPSLECGGDQQLFANMLTP